jgi:hypothetical protein
MMPIIVLVIGEYERLFQRTPIVIPIIIEKRQMPEIIYYDLVDSNRFKHQNKKMWRNSVRRQGMRHH